VSFDYHRKSRWTALPFLSPVLFTFWVSHPLAQRLQKPHYVYNAFPTLLGRLVSHWLPVLNLFSRRIVPRSRVPPFFCILTRFGLYLGPAFRRSFDMLILYHWATARALQGLIMRRAFVYVPLLCLLHASLDPIWRP